jgi:hypothetical protein
VFLFIVMAKMKMLNRHRVAFLVLSAAALAGCTSGPKNPYHVGDERPPVFLSGPVAVLFTNLDGFSAKLTGSVPSDAGSRHAVAGDLLGREGSLIFQPQSSVKGKKARFEGGMFFIWNEKAHAGLVLSDPLQAYAPTAEATQPTNVQFNTLGAMQEEANGHPCRRVEAVVQSSDGSTARFRVWQAEDAGNFPVRISGLQGPGEMLLNFSDLRLELPAPTLFSPPDGFIRYDSPVALMNELIVRQNTLAKKNPSEAELSPNMQNWRPTPPQ